MGISLLLMVFLLFNMVFNKGAISDNVENITRISDLFDLKGFLFFKLVLIRK